MLEGFCPKCGNRVLGWALLDSRFQNCDLCNVRYLISKNGPSTRVEFFSVKLEKQSVGHSVAVQQHPSNR